MYKRLKGRAQEIPGCSYPHRALKAEPRTHCIPRLCSPWGTPGWGQMSNLKKRPQYSSSPGLPRTHHRAKGHPVNELGRVPKVPEATFSESSHCS